MSQLDPNVAGAEVVLAATRELLQATLHTDGTDFFRALARSLANSLGVDFGFVGQLDTQRGVVTTHAVWNVDTFVDNFQYALSGTPCQEVLNGGVCYHPRDVQAAFPDDHMLVEMGIHSYLGVGVRAPNGPTSGIVVALHTAPTSLPYPELKAILDVFGHRVALELERIETGNRLRASEVRYREIVDSCPEGVWTLDVNGTTVFANTLMAEMLGYTPSEMVGRSFLEFMAEDSRAHAKSNLTRRQRGIAERHEFRFQHKQGHTVSTVISATPMRDDRGEVTGLLGFVSDLTERQALEGRIQHAQKLQSLGVLAGGIAHDFNNLLTGILGNAGLCLSQVGEDSPLHPLLTDIESAALRAAELTQQMLAYAGRGRFVIGRIRLNAVVEEMTQLLSTAISKRAVVNMNLANDIPEIDGDATQLRQIVMNLITNASDALGEHSGTINISSGVMAADFPFLRGSVCGASLPEGVYAFLEVSDSGMGMDTLTREKVFDPFFTTKFTGRGLGLAAALGILRSHGGTVTVQSEPGKGSTFRILLPVATESLAPLAVAEMPPLTERTPATGTVLVADDHPMVTALARRVLEAAGYQVLVARDGEEAVELFREFQTTVDAVVLDLTMPKLNGHEALLQLAELKPSVRVVLTSGYSEQDATAQLGGQPVATFLRKPWLPEQLLDAVRVALGAPPAKR
ncbi:MAG: hypothetical protein RJA70_2418 [Pseudomonadota bacterium]